MNSFCKDRQLKFNNETYYFSSLFCIKFCHQTWKMLSNTVLWLSWISSMVKVFKHKRNTFYRLLHFSFSSGHRILYYSCPFLNCNLFPPRPPSHFLLVVGYPAKDYFLIPCTLEWVLFSSYSPFVIREPVWAWVKILLGFSICKQDVRHNGSEV